MKINRRIFLSLCIIVTFLMATGTPAIAQEDFVRAKIGVLIKSGNKAIRSKSKGKLKAGDLLRVYVHPEKNAHVYIVHTDSETATLLNAGQKKAEGATLILPSVQDFYEVDGNSSIENITIICSPNDIKEVSDLLKSGEAPRSKWKALEEKLYEKSKIDLTSKAEKPFTIAGNVRGGSGAGDPFLKKLRIYTGKSLLVKRYEFRVKK